MQMQMVHESGLYLCAVLLHSQNMASTYFKSVVQVFKLAPVLIYFYAINSLGTVLVCHLESHVKSVSCSGPIREAV